MGVSITIYNHLLCLLSIDYHFVIRKPFYNFFHIFLHLDICGLADGTISTVVVSSTYLKVSRSDFKSFTWMTNPSITNIVPWGTDHFIRSHSDVEFQILT